MNKNTDTDNYKRTFYAANFSDAITYLQYKDLKVCIPEACEISYEIDYSKKKNEEGRVTGYIDFVLIDKHPLVSLMEEVSKVRNEAEQILFDIIVEYKILNNDGSDLAAHFIEGFKDVSFHKELKSINQDDITSILTVVFSAKDTIDYHQVI